MCQIINVINHKCNSLLTIIQLEKIEFKDNTKTVRYNTLDNIDKILIFNMY